MKIFIEFWKAKNSWFQLSTEERITYTTNMIPVMQDLASKGVITEAWGENSDKSSYKADYDFYAITKFPNQELLDYFNEVLENANWYNYFEQINVSGDNLGVETVISKMIIM